MTEQAWDGNATPFLPYAKPDLVVVRRVFFE
jgi:hypothetical protein